MSDFFLIGHPIELSLSPLIHNKLFVKKGLSHHYDLLKTEGDFEQTLKILKGSGVSSKEGSDDGSYSIKGFNVTIPFKEKILPFIDQLTPRAKAAGAVNTVLVTGLEGKWIGDNTDGIGFVTGLHSRGLSLKGKDVVLLGAGGAARGIAHAVSQEGVNSITLCARRLEQAQCLITDISPFAASVVKWHAQTLTQQKENQNYCPDEPASYIDDTVNCFDELLQLLENADVLINTLPKEVDIGDYQWVLNDFKGRHAADIVYRPRMTPFLKWAKSEGINTYYGLDMLFYQAALAQEFWLGHHDCDLKVLCEEVYIESGD